MFKRTTLSLALTALCACSGGDKKTDEQPTETSTSLLEQCQQLADKTQKEAQMYATMGLSSRETMEAAYIDFQQTRATWEAEDNVCAREGADVTDRMALQQRAQSSVDQAANKGTKRIISHLSPNIDEARAFMKVVFSDGTKLSDDVLNAAVDVDRRYRQRLLTKFKETGKYGQLDDALETTCVFGDAKIDPNSDAGITENFKTVFTGTGEVHALCRIPAPADKYGGDPNGQVTIVIDDDDDTSNGVVHRGELGTPEKWGSTQWFSGRFSMPQGKYAKKDSGYYRVFIEVVRPEMGDEKLVENWFYWHR